MAAWGTMKVATAISIVGLTLLFFICTFFGFGFQTIPVLTWVYYGASVFFFRMHVSEHPAFALLHYAASCIGGTLATFGFFSTPIMSTEEALLIALGYWLVMNAFLTFSLFVDLKFVEKFRTRFHVLAFPVVQTSLSFVWSNFSHIGAHGNIAYTQAGEASVVHLASIAGLHGIMFLICFVASCGISIICDCPHGNIREKGDSKNLCENVAIEPWFKNLKFHLGVIILSVLIYGGIRNNCTNDTFFQKHIENMTIHPPHTIICNTSVGNSVSTFKEWIARDPTIKMIVLSEQALYTVNFSEFQEFADETGVYCLLGSCHKDNSLIAITPNREPIIYVKSNPVPFIDTNLKKPGDGQIKYFDTEEFGRVGFAICFDADFPSYIQQASSLGIDLLVQSANTYGPLRHVEAGYARFRAVEQGVTVLRCCSNGVSGLYDPFYKVIQEEETFPAAHKSSMKVSWSFRPRTWTLYGAMGDLPHWILLVISVGLAVIAFLPMTILQRMKIPGLAKSLHQNAFTDVKSESSTKLELE